MNRRKPMTARGLAREKILFRYSSALERGDFETVSAVLREAEADPILERMLLEMDAVHRADFAPPPVLPSPSMNHNHRTRGEDRLRHVTYPTMTGRLPEKYSPRRWYPALTLAAAMVALALFAIVLIARRPPDNPQQGNPAVVLQNETATALPSATFTPTPVSQQMASTWTATPVPSFTPTATILTIINGTPIPRTPACDFAGAFLQTPFDGMVISEPITVIGVATDDQFATYKLELGGPSTNGSVVVISESQQPLSDIGVLGEFDPSRFQPGDYVFRLTIFDNGGTLRAACVVSIIIGAANQASSELIATIVPSSTICQGITVENGINVFSDPSINGTVIGRISSSTRVDILVSRYLSDTVLMGLWYYARSGEIEGWIRSEFVMVNSPCPDTSRPNPSYPCPVTALAVTATFTPPPRLAVDEAVEPLDVTATPVSMLPVPTVVPPCAANYPNATPTAGIPDTAWNSVMLLETVEGIPANTPVRIISAYYDGRQWMYEVMAKDGQTMGVARESQLTVAPGVTPGAATPTAVFGGALGMGFYAAVTTQVVGDIPAGTPVRVGSAWYNGIEWIYNITDATGRENTASESQLAVAPDYTPGMPTPTAAYFDLRGQVLVTRAQVGDTRPTRRCRLRQAIMTVQNGYTAW